MYFPLIYDYDAVFLHLTYISDCLHLLECHNNISAAIWNYCIPVIPNSEINRYSPASLCHSMKFSHHGIFPLNHSCPANYIRYGNYTLPPYTCKYNACHCCFTSIALNGQTSGSEQTEHPSQSSGSILTLPSSI